MNSICQIIGQETRALGKCLLADLIKEHLRARV